MKVFQKINRKIYFDELKDCLNTPVIKILKGIRGCGKTSILVEFYEYVKQTYPESNSIFLSFEEYPYSLITSHKELFDLIISKLKPNCQNYLFLDEVQSINHFEEVILHFWNQKKCDVYVTGSNSYLLSGQIATKFTRRNYQISVEPFNFCELLEFKKINGFKINSNELFLEYCRFGGLPQIYYFDDENHRTKLLNSIFLEIIDKDILPNKIVNNYQEFKRILKFICENVGNVFSSGTIYDAIKLDNKESSISRNTIFDYVKTLCNSLILNEVVRANVIGKEFLKQNSKFYLQDIGLRNAILGNPSRIYFPKLLENIVYLELKHRGYDVYIGKIFRSEIDFIATKNNVDIYIQICEGIDTTEKFLQEIYPFSLIKNNYRKILIVKEKPIIENEKGIEIVSIIDFLTNPNFV